MSTEAAERRAFQRAIEQSLPDFELRYLRAWRLISDGRVRITPGYTQHAVEAEVASGSEPGVIYDVLRDPREGWACNCTDFAVHSRRQEFRCKHIMAVSWVWGSVREREDCDERSASPEDVVSEAARGAAGSHLPAAQRTE